MTIMSTVVQPSFSAVVHMLSNPQPFLLTHNLTSTFLLQWKQSACFLPQISPGALPHCPLTLILPSNSSSELTARSKAGSTPFRSLLWACKDRYSIFKSATILYSVLFSFELWFCLLLPLRVDCKLREPRSEFSTLPVPQSDWQWFDECSVVFEQYLESKIYSKILCCRMETTMYWWSKFRPLKIHCTFRGELVHT